MMTIIADTCGSHDTIFGCCSFELDKVRYGKTNSESCQRNFERELKKYGMGEKDVVSNINFFMNVPHFLFMQTIGVNVILLTF